MKINSSVRSCNQTLLLREAYLFSRDLLGIILTFVMFVAALFQALYQLVPTPTLGTYLSTIKYVVYIQKPKE